METELPIQFFSVNDFLCIRLHSKEAKKKKRIMCVCFLSSKEPCFRFDYYIFVSFMENAVLIKNRNHSI